MSHEILSLRLENFLSFGEAEFDFENAGFVLVEGRNGAGKSGMVDGILWVLFGETLRGYKHDRVVHRKVGEGCLATVRLRTDGKEWGVTRARKHKKLKNSLTIDAPGFVAAGESDVQAEIERRLGCSCKTFLSSVVFGQDRAYRFSSLTDAEQKKILDEVIGVERFAQACAVARKQVSTIQADLDNDRRALEKAAKARDEVQADAVDLQVKDADFAESQRRKVDAEREKLARANDWLVKARKVANVEKLKEALDAAQHAVALYERKLAKAAEADASAASALTSVNARWAEKVKLLRDSDRLGGDCPTCGQKPTKRLITLLAEARAKADELEAEVGEASKQRDVATVALGVARAKLKEAREEVTEAQRSYNEGLGRVADAAAWRARKVEHMGRIAELEREANPYAALAAKARSRHAQLVVEVEQLEGSVEHGEAKLRRAEFWVKAYGASGLRSLLVDSSLPLLNEEAARVSRVLTGGAIRIEFSAVTEQKSGKSVDRFEVRVDNKEGAGDYAGNSSGERAKVDLCVGLALQRLVASRSSAAFNLAVFDEVFDHLDSAAHEPVIEVLASLDRDSVFVVSHDEDLKAWFPATMRLVKRGGFSHVEVG